VTNLWKHATLSKPARLIVCWRENVNHIPVGIAVPSQKQRRKSKGAKVLKPRPPFMPLNGIAFWYNFLTP
jgi:hypothetical protein